MSFENLTRLTEQMGMPAKHTGLYAGKRDAIFYDRELTGFLDDLPFYLKHLPGEARDLLELGCGTGRLGLALARKGYKVTGIDRSNSMLRLAKAKSEKEGISGFSPVCMDMTRMAFRKRFDAVLIPYHTINLLVEPDALQRCLQQARGFLKPDGRLLLQIYIPDRSLRALEGKRQFQFQIFEDAGGDKFIKEIFKGYDPGLSRLEVREIYRLRPSGGAKEDWQCEYQLLGYPPEKWQEILAAAGFTVKALYGDYSLKAFNAAEDHLMLVAAAPG